MKKPYLFLIVLCIDVLTPACTLKERGKSKNVASLYSGPITIKDKMFVDNSGRQVLLNGINLVNKDPKVNYIGNEGPEVFENFKKWGFNVIRLGVIWDGLEPEPGVYNEAYLQKIDKQIEMAKDNGLYVFLDMHQDLFSVKYSDGAPEWATLDEGKPHVRGNVWSDAYLISPAVQTSWDNFWNNAPAPDGVGVQEHYAKAWQHVAKRYVNNSTVIGFDIMNEPFVGSKAQMFMPLLFSAYARSVPTKSGKPLTANDVGMMWADIEGRYKALQGIADKERFSQVIDAVYELNSVFESGPLQAFYQRVADAIREVDKDKILFFNHSYFCNSGVITALEPVKRADGQPDLAVAYAAHGYDLLVDTDSLSNSSDARLELIFERINESGKRMNIPVLIGEWGALGSDSPGRTELAHKHLRLFEKFLFSNSYWAYGPDIENRSYFKQGVVRPYPAVVAGELISYGYNPDSGEFTCRWLEKANINSPTGIYIPALNALSYKKIKLTPNTDGITLEPIEGSSGGYIIISATGKSQQREISFTIKQEKMSSRITMEQPARIKKK